MTPEQKYIQSLEALVKRQRTILELARNSHGKMLTSYPAQDAWVYHQLDQKIQSVLDTPLNDPRKTTTTAE